MGGFLWVYVSSSPTLWVFLNDSPPSLSHTHTHTHTHTLSLSRSLSLSHTQTHTHPLSFSLSSCCTGLQSCSNLSSTKNQTGKYPGPVLIECAVKIISYYVWNYLDLITSRWVLYLHLGRLSKRNGVWTGIIKKFRRAFFFCGWIINTLMLISTHLII